MSKQQQCTTPACSLRKPLTLDEEIALARQARNGCRTSLRKLIEDNQRFVKKIAYEYRSNVLPVEDLIAEGNLGLVEAALRYDSNRGCKFITYARWWVRKAIMSAVSRHARLVRIPDYQQTKHRQVRATEKELSADLGRKPNNAELQDKLGRYFRKSNSPFHGGYYEVSLDAPANPSSTLCMSDSLSARDAISQEDALIRRESATLLEQALTELCDQERQVISFRFGLDEFPPMTLGEVGSLLGLSRERIRQIENDGKARLRRIIQRHHAGRRIYPKQEKLPSRITQAALSG